MTYLKAVLTVIALLLAVLAMRPAPVHADNDVAAGVSRQIRFCGDQAGPVMDRDVHLLL